MIGLSSVYLEHKLIIKLILGFSKLLIANGEGNLNSVDVVNLASESSTCSSLPDFKLKSKHSIGFLFGNQPIICGGLDGSSPQEKCYSLDPEAKEWTPISSMIVPRADSAIASNDAETEFYVIGGQGSDEEFMKSVEVYSSKGWTPLNADLESGVKSSCAVTLADSSILLIGGSKKEDEATQSTYLFSTSGKTWRTFSPLVTGRRHHSCGMVHSTAASGDYVVVAGGWNGGSLSSIEVLEPGSKTWKLGPELPRALHGGSMLEDTYNQRLLYIGGSNDESGKSSDIFALNFPLTVTSKWEVLSQKLKQPRQFSTAFLIPDEFATCVAGSTELPKENKAPTSFVSYVLVIFSLLLPFSLLY